MGFYGNILLEKVSIKDKIKKKAIIAQVNADLNKGFIPAAKETLLNYGIKPDTKDPDYHKLWAKIGIPENPYVIKPEEKQILERFADILKEEVPKIFNKYKNKTDKYLKGGITLTFQMNEISYYKHMKEDNAFGLDFYIFAEKDPDGADVYYIKPIIDKIVSEIKNNSKMKSFHEIKSYDIEFDRYMNEIRLVVKL